MTLDKTYVSKDLVLGKRSLLVTSFIRKQVSQSSFHSTRNSGNFFRKFAEDPIIDIFAKMRPIQTGDSGRKISGVRHSYKKDESVRHIF